MKNKNTSLPLGAGIGLLIGVVIGSNTDDIGSWIPLGLCLGAGIGLALSDSNKKKTD